MTCTDVFVGGRLGDLIVEAVARYPDRVALVDVDGTEVTYSEMGARIARAMHRLSAIGLASGEAVAQLSGNRVELFCVMAAAYIGGWCSVTLHPMNSAEDHAFVLRDSRAKVFISEDKYAGRAEELLGAGIDVPHWFSHDADGVLPHFWSSAERAPLRAVGAAEDIIRIAYTGGTTGRPKGVMLCNRSLVTNTLLWLAGLPWPDAVRTLCSAPITHGAGSLIYPTLVRGGRVVLQRGFDKDQWLQIVYQQRIQMTFIVPTMLYALLDHSATRSTDLTSLVALIYGAAPVSPAALKRALETFGPVLAQTYGQSEAPNTVLLLTQAEHASADERRLAAAGRPFPGIQVALLDDQHVPVAPGEVGEICVRGPLVMSGYRGLPEETRAVLAGGWLHTGDLATRDDDGYFYVVDRKKDLIISGGFNVYPKEVEDALMSHPGVSAACVIGVPDEKWGEAVKAIVVRRVSVETTQQALIDHVKLHKGAVCAPKTVDFVDQLPLTGLGKPDKKALRQKYWANAARAIA